MNLTSKDTMEAQPEGETANNCPPAFLDSEDSDDESSQEEQPTTNWNELSIIERVGLNSVEMSEKDLETTFAQIALAFRCDQYTLKQRLQAEEHARNLAEENVQLELTRGRETLEMLKGLCLDSKRSKILQGLELSLDILGGTVERISNTAEVLGAVHQEARVSRAVELMVAHVENLRRQHDRNLTELEEAKRTIQQQSSSRNSMDHRPSPDPDDNDMRKKGFLQNGGRRRVSVSLISTQIPEKIKQNLRKQASVDGFSSSKKSFSTCRTPSPTSELNCFSLSKDEASMVEDRPQDPDETPSEVTQVPTPQPSPTSTSECLPSKQTATRKTQNKSSPLDSLRQRHKTKSALPKKKSEKDKKTVNIYRRPSGGTCGSLWRQRPLLHWLYRCRWVLMFTYLFVLFCVIMLAYLLLEAL